MIHTSLLWTQFVDFDEFKFNLRRLIQAQVVPFLSDAARVCAFPLVMDLLRVFVQCFPREWLAAQTSLPKCFDPFAELLAQLASEATPEAREQLHDIAQSHLLLARRHL